MSDLLSAKLLHQGRPIDASELVDDSAILDRADRLIAGFIGVLAKIDPSELKGFPKSALISDRQYAGLSTSLNATGLGSGH